MNKNHLLLLLLLLITSICLGLMVNTETYTNSSNVANVDEAVKGLYPTKNLGEICHEKGGFPPAYMPTQCIHQDGSVNKHANCECMDPTMTYCTSCYPDVKHIELSAEELNNEFSYMSYNR